MKHVAASAAWRDLAAAAGREARRRPWRFAACASGYAIAVGMGVLLLAALVFSRNIQSGILGSTGTHFIVYSPACAEVASLTTAELAMLASGTRPPRCEEKCKVCTGCNKKPLDLANEAFVAQQVETKLLPFGILEQARREPGLFRGVSPYLMFRCRDPQDGHRFTVGGFDPADTVAVPPAVCSPSDIIEGAFLHPNDTGLALVEQGYAAARGLRLGSAVTISGWPFIVIGVVAPGVRPAKADVLLTFSDAEKVISRRLRSPLFQEMNVLLVEVAQAEVQDAAMARMRQIVQTGLISSFACYEPAAEVLGLSRGVIYAAAVLLALLAAAFGLKTQLAAIRERRRELGILRAIGWSRRSIHRLMTLEALLPGAVGGVVGAAVAAVVLPFVSLEYWTGVPARLDPLMLPLLAMTGALLAVVGGIAAGAAAGRSAVRELPARQLRQY
ncbi:MAG TPA: ABC transporter permease [Candidatus Ozemobacteraceae bacterium]|nr:ABC transporter permease [Candidatus Ozemobacteraceae bacterium]